ncbi:Arf-GAP with coiled-coil, ANK repeat and PH domain-containing protein 2 [Goodea atripinnis]|uniref:Arf-GAP with coiled-coil, ANK repeat and PH domain-containing protein n=1 Tax=Goodea atripinnis TaxID=208336 RepID=A0ABV0MFD9_9TELE
MKLKKVERLCREVWRSCQQLDQLVVDAAKEKRDMEQKHSTIQQKDFSNDDTKLEYNVDADNGIAMEGYLFKRASNAFKTWNRRWFSIQNNQLVYQKKFKDNPTVVVEDLRLCTVKHCEDIERRFCFEVVSPTKSCMMQADSEKLRQAWIKAVQNSIATAFRDKGDNGEKLDRKSSTSTGSLDSGGEPKERSLKGESALQKVLAIPGNACCCDCGQADPRWASINLGITLCIQCSGIHRSLGVHFSKVRSLTLDSWEPELLKQTGEEAEQQLRPSAAETTSFHTQTSAGLSCHRTVSADSGIQNSADGSREMLATAASSNSLTDAEAAESPPMPATLPAASPCKEVVFYEPKEYSPGLQLYWASFTRSLPDMAEAVAHGAEVNWVNTEEDKRTPLIMAVHGGSLVTCEFLLQNAANVNQLDAQGRGPLHHATMLGHTGLRLAKMNEEMREAEGPYNPSGDETYQDIFQDFTHMASNDPDKLNRYQQYDQQRP